MKIKAENVINDLKRKDIDTLKSDKPKKIDYDEMDDC